MTLPRLLSVVRDGAIVTLVVTISACNGQNSPEAVQETSRPPNVVLVIWDTARADHLTPYGYHRDTTPNLARIAADSLLFEKAIAPAPWTVPSMASLFTGLYVQNHRVSFDTAHVVLDLPSEAGTLAEALRRSGYTTALFSASGIYDKPGFRRGFDILEICNERHLVAKAMDFLDGAGPRPAFVVLHWLNPHAPYVPRPEHDMWAPGGLPPFNISATGKGKGCVTKESVFSGRLTLNEAQWQQLEAGYDGELHQNDAALGELWRSLRDRQLADSTLFVFTSDHGEGFNEHERQRVWHDLPYETILHVPLILRLPDVLPARRVKTQVTTIDIFATILDVAKARPPSPVNSVSLLPLAERESAGRTVIGGSHYADGVVFYRGEGFKLLFSRVGDERLEIYDLKRDPGEHHNLALSRPELVVHLKARLESHAAGSRVEIDRGAEATEAEQSQLSALGYVE